MDNMTFDGIPNSFYFQLLWSDGGWSRYTFVKISNSHAIMLRKGWHGRMLRLAGQAVIRPVREGGGT